MSGGDRPLLTPGHTCWRVEEAARFAYIVDAADYFAHVKAAMLRAQRRIILIGWDFDTRMTFERGGKKLAGPNQFGAFLRWLVRRRERLEICVLKANLGLVPGLQTLWRGVIPVALVNRLSSERLEFAVDGAHPTGAVHHQKIVVVDDGVAFCGGIDLTVDRWDTSEHPDDGRLRRTAGRTYGPRHEVATAVDGAAARALAELARNRWRTATGQFLAPVEPGPNLWPGSLTPALRDVAVGIARTQPALPPGSEAREVEALNLAAIAAARQTIYLENQYLASRPIAEALAARLQEPDGPEIVVILPRSSESPLERTSMDTARHALLGLLWAADEYDRLGVFWPVTDEGTPIYVHSKVMVIDDRLLRIGSSNLNNRSMGFDSECDVAIEAVGDARGAADVRATIICLRNALVAEHLGVSASDLDEALSRCGSVLGAVRALHRDGRTLRLFTRETIAGEAGPLAENILMDPDRVPRSLASGVQRFLAGFRTNRPPSGYGPVMTANDSGPQQDSSGTGEQQPEVPPANPAYSTPPPEGLPDADDE
ncbi:phosphatidylserine/phosphatidylglycerophosphate/cardiolipin synthase [Mycolicibacterium chubuense NBB4]|uniref:Phosphatidylserine/phosphatidylglycerophosphate/ cardiolipin synthase n=1 Tax=Mycolicibacterium chubuense (strain NBB4) TaxID=710421 RepID=I4BRD9_MYCCN|nr:phospholipase D-like domain-containing protein [Mycolicibacterium chubuense]AFM19846.1 phosphatidylserine/phosphatidylglycerophosphate/cardiolipin synthase [Mycolicibacterium chubuense NBB4]